MGKLYIYIINEPPIFARPTGKQLDACYKSIWTAHKLFYLTICDKKTELIGAKSVMSATIAQL